MVIWWIGGKITEKAVEAFSLKLAWALYIIISELKGVQSKKKIERCAEKYLDWNGASSLGVKPTNHACSL